MNIKLSSGAQTRLDLRDTDMCCIFSMAAKLNEIDRLLVNTTYDRINVEIIDECSCGNTNRLHVETSEADA
jgi:hypothetical protein